MNCTGRAAAGILFEKGTAPENFAAGAAVAAIVEPHRLPFLHVLWGKVALPEVAQFEVKVECPPADSLDIPEQC